MSEVQHMFSEWCCVQRQYEIPPLNQGSGLSFVRVKPNDVSEALISRCYHLESMCLFNQEQQTGRKRSNELTVEFTADTLPLI